MSKGMKNKHISEATFADIVNTCAISCCQVSQQWLYYGGAAIT